MRIGKLVELCGTSVRTLRYYERQGLLHPRRATNGYRRYEAIHVEQVREIRRMLASGFTTRAIREFLPCLAESPAAGGCEAGLQRHLAKLHELDRLIAALRERRTHVLQRLRRFGVAPEQVPETKEVGTLDAKSSPSGRTGLHHLRHRRR
jgi:DNA-binding transcriptional MerR regulator